MLKGQGEHAELEKRFARAEEPYDSFEKAARAGILNWLKLAGEDTKRGTRTAERRTPLVPAPGPWTTKAKTKSRRETSAV